MSDRSSAAVKVGLGCLYFVPVLAPGEVQSFPWSDDQWTQALEQSLGQIPSITALNVRCRGAGRFASTEEAENLETFDCGNFEHPFYGTGVQFTVTIPQRLHCEFRPFADYRPLDAERFEVTILYGRRGPVSFVRALEYGQRTQATSQALYIALVREFLMRELERVGARLLVRNTGPSPFHANFVIEPLDGMGSDLGYEWDSQKLGYADVRLLYDPDIHGLDEFYRQTLLQIVEPFSDFYHFVRMRNRRMLAEEKVASKSDKLIAIHQSKGLKAWLTKTFRSGGLARELILDAIAAKQADVESRSEVSKALLKSYAEVQIPELVEMCEDVNVGFVERIEMAEQVARTLEGGRVSQYEVLMVSLSTILGGVAGTVAALVTN